MFGDFNRGCDCCFHCKKDLTHHFDFCSGQPEVARSHLNVLVGICSTIKVTLHDTQSFVGIASPEFISLKDKLLSSDGLDK